MTVDTLIAMLFTSIDGSHNERLIHITFASIYVMSYLPFFYIFNASKAMYALYALCALGLFYG